jgi:hypothetical protein
MSESKDKPEIHSTFPLKYLSVDEPLLVEVPLSKQEYLAALLKVPESGTPWLDEMIEKSLRNDFAKATLIVAYTIWGNSVKTTEFAFEVADALIAESKKKKEEGS